MQVLKPHVTQFPRSFEFLKADLPTVRASAPNVWRAFLDNSKLTDNDAQAAVNGATPPLLFAQSLGPFTWAQFDPEVPNRIEISSEVLEKFEQTPNDPNAQKFLRSKALHEMCHWGCFRARVPDPDEAGEKFEAQAFGAELRPWWLNGAAPAVQPAAAPAIDLDIFKSPVARAAALRRALTGPGHVPGRQDDPNHKVFGGIDVAEGLPRGFRNNNPGNIRVGQPWNGLAEPTEQTAFQLRETSFCVFREPEWGLRAIARLLRRYKNDFNVSTPRKIIERWAPASDNNNVDSYSGQLAKALGVQRDDTVDADNDDQVIRMMTAIATHENGSKPPYADLQFRTALLLL